MNGRRSWFLTLTGLLVCAAPAFSQQRQTPVPEGGAVQIMLLRQPSVRKELNLTDDQVTRIRDFARQQWTKAQALESASQEEQRVKFDALTRENEAFLAQALSPSQRARLDQITVQIAGLLWCSQERIAAELNLTPDQRTKITQLQGEARREMQELLQSKEGGDKHAKMKELRSTNRKRLFEVLSDSQEARWKELSGPKFEGELSLDHDNSGK